MASLRSASFQSSEVHVELFNQLLGWKVAAVICYFTNFDHHKFVILVYLTRSQWVNRAYTNNHWASMVCVQSSSFADCVEFAKGAFTFQSATHGFQHFSYLVSATDVVDRMFVTIFLILDLHSWFVSDMYKTKMTILRYHTSFTLIFVSLNSTWILLQRLFILRNPDIFQWNFFLNLEEIQ